MLDIDLIINQALLKLQKEVQLTNVGYDSFNKRILWQNKSNVNYLTLTKDQILNITTDFSLQWNDSQITL